MSAEGLRGGDGRRVLMTVRDELVVEWLSLVKISSMEGVRWLMGALHGRGRPVSVRAAQMWCARMEKIGQVERGRVSVVAGSLVWPTRAASGRTPPSLLRETTRHEVSVSVVSARYVAGGWSWDLDRPSSAAGKEHKADGIAFRDGVVELTEAELTAKDQPRYRRIFEVFRERVEQEGVTAVRYFCTDLAASAVRRALEDPKIGRGLDGIVQVHEVFDRRGLWESGVQLAALASGGEAPGAGR